MAVSEAMLDAEAGAERRGRDALVEEEVLGVEVDETGSDGQVGLGRTPTEVVLVVPGELHGVELGRPFDLGRLLEGRCDLSRAERRC